MRRIIAALVFLALTVFSHAAEGTTLTQSGLEELFRTANGYYQNQQFDKARETYLEIADTGVQSPELFYNLGSTAARLNNKAEAVLYLTRARELTPRDPDVNLNLRRVAPPNVLKSLTSRDPMHMIADQLSVREWITIFFASYLLTCLVGAIYLALMRRRAAPVRYTFYALIGITLLVAVFAGYRYYHVQYVQYAVVAEAGASVRSGPGDKFAQVDTVPEGEIIKRLANSEEGWAQVQLSDGRPGYILSKSILLI